MSSLAMGAVLGTGTIGVLAAGFLLTALLSLSISWVFGLGMLLFVGAGAVALVMRAM